VAGSGLPDVYEYLSDTFPERVDVKIHSAIASAGDLKAAIIAQNKDKNELCRRTMDIFLTHYGSEAGVACLKWVPTGGLFITGGNTPKNIAEIQNPNGLFMQALFDKGRLSGVVRGCPVYAVMVEDLGERGAHFAAYKELQVAVQASRGSSNNGSRNGGNITAFRNFLWTAAAAVAVTALSVNIYSGEGLGVSYCWKSVIQPFFAKLGVLLPTKLEGMSFNGYVLTKRK